MALGLTVATSAFYLQHVQQIKYGVQNILAAVAISIGLASIETELENKYSSTASDNSSTWKTEVTYSYVA